MNKFTGVNANHFQLKAKTTHGIQEEKTPLRTEIGS
jgi:hypothetical protein